MESTVFFMPRTGTHTASLSDPSLYINRDVSLLRFQRRVLEEALDPENPVLERIKFLSIFGSNMDEFYMVRLPRIRDENDPLRSGPAAAGHEPAADPAAIRGLAAD